MRCWPTCPAGSSTSTTEAAQRGSDRRAARLDPRFHDGGGGLRHPGPWRYFHRRPAAFVGHNDIAPYNVCFDGDDLVGVFDWDMSGPTTLSELAFIAWNCVPLWTDL